MPTALKWIAIAVALAIVLVLLGAQFGLLRGSAPSSLGLRDGKLKPPSRTPNSVSSQADLWPDHPQRDYARIAPLPRRGDAAQTMAALRSIVEAMPGAKLVDQRSDYLYVQFESRVLKFVDDAEFWFDPAIDAVQVRSASRVGRRDFGVNRGRIEAVRERLARSVGGRREVPDGP